MAQHFRNTERQETEAANEIQDVQENLSIAVDGLSETLDEPGDVFAAPDASVDALESLVVEAAPSSFDDSMSDSAFEYTPSAVSPDVSDPFASPATSEGGFDSTGVVAADLDEPFDAPARTTMQVPATPTPAPAAVSAPAAQVDRSGDPAISFKNVSMIYPAQPNKPALDNVSLDIYPGEFVFIVGHSGSGKSTFIRLLTRELKASKGQVIVGGQDLGRMRNRKVPFLRRQLGCVFQDFKLLPDKTVAQNVAFALECIGKPKKLIDAQVPEVLRLVGLAEKMNAYPDQLSGGEQQRVAVARAMVNRPPLLICDEPTGNLDPAISMGIMRLLDAINRNGTTVVMATHDRQMVDTMQKRVIQLDGGQLVRDQEGGYGIFNGIEGGDTYYV